MELNIGKKYSHPTGISTLKLLPDNNGVVIMLDEKGEYIKVAADALKPLPTEEEKLVDETSNIIMESTKIWGSGKICKNESLVICNALIKAGYRKVETLSFCKFTECNNNDKGDIYNWLITNNHIIAE